MQNFVISGKAKTVFRLIELKAKQDSSQLRGIREARNPEQELEDMMKRNQERNGIT